MKLNRNLADDGVSRTKCDFPSTECDFKLLSQLVKRWEDTTDN